MTESSQTPDESTRKQFLNSFQAVSLVEIEAALTTWRHMIYRCLDPENANFKNYGGRGITVCERWRLSFPAFLYDMGPRPEGFTIDRKDNNGDYEPDNCRWATPLEQGCNKRNNRYIELNGQRVTQSEVARIAGVSDATIMRRMERGYSVEEAIGGRVKRVKLTPANVEQIRKLSADGYRDWQLAAHFRVSRQMIGSIRRGVAWRL